MPSPNCIRCEARTFAASPDAMEAAGTSYVLVFCTNCGAVAGVLSKAEKAVDVVLPAGA